MEYVWIIVPRFLAILEASVVIMKELVNPIWYFTDHLGRSDDQWLLKASPGYYRNAVRPSSTRASGKGLESRPCRPNH